MGYPWGLPDTCQTDLLGFWIVSQLQLCKVYFSFQKNPEAGKCGSILGQIKKFRANREHNLLSETLSGGRAVHISYWKMPPQEMSAGGKRLNQLFKTPNFPLTSHIWQICDTKANFGTMSGILRWFSSLWICLDPENNEDELEHVYHHHRHPHHHNILTSLGFAWTLQTMSTSSDLETP